MTECMCTISLFFFNNVTVNVMRWPVCAWLVSPCMALCVWHTRYYYQALRLAGFGQMICVVKLVSILSWFVSNSQTSTAGDSASTFSVSHIIC